MPASSNSPPCRSSPLRRYPAWAGVGVLLIVFGYALFLAMEFMLLWRVHGDDPAPKATGAQLLKAWFSDANGNDLCGAFFVTVKKM